MREGNHGSLPAHTRTSRLLPRMFPAATSTRRGVNRRLAAQDRSQHRRANRTLETVGQTFVSVSFFFARPFPPSALQPQFGARLGSKLSSCGLARDSNTVSYLYQNCPCGQVTRSAKPPTFSPTVT